jgi:hypothetical protein
MHRAIATYAAERDAGLTNIIQEKSSIAIACPVTVDERILSAVASTSHEESAKKWAKVAHATNKGQYDLHYLHTILTTTGWNKNDDVFDREETWAARLTPEDKPFNFQHNPRHILGHITGCCGVDDNYSLIPNNTVIDDLPDKFHLLTSAVLYKHLSCRDETLEDETAEMLQEIAAGKWMVSMEVLFSNFDYAVTAPDGLSHVVARSNDSAFLTKHLRAYGGNGEYEGHRVGRMMRNLAFSGKGLVDDPGNPESHILNDVSRFEGIVASFNEKDGLIVPQSKIIINSNTKKETSMADTITSVVTDAQWQDAQRAIAELRDRLDKAGEEKIQAEYATLRSEIEALTSTIAEKDTEISNLRSAKAEAEKATESATADHDKTKSELSTASEKLEEIAATSAKTERVSQLVDKGVDKADAEQMAEKFSGVDDEIFAEFVSTQADLVEARGKFDKDKFKKKGKGKDEDKKDEKADASSEEEEGDEASAASALENGEEEDGIDLSAASSEQDDEDAELMASMASTFGSMLSPSDGPEEDSK